MENTEHEVTLQSKIYGKNNQQQFLAQFAHVT